MAALEKALNHKERLVRATAIQALVQLGPQTPGVVDALVQALDHRDVWTVALATKSLGAMGSSAQDVTPVLALSLGNENPALADAAHQALVQIGASGPEAAVAVADALAPILQNTDFGVRLEVVRVLTEISLSGPIGAAAASPLIVQATNDAHGQVRDLAQTGLLQLFQEDAETVAVVVPLLREVLAGLDRVQHLALLEQLIPVGLTSPQAAAGVGSLLLAEVGGDDPDLRYTAHQGLVQIESSEAKTGLIPVLIEALDDENPVVRAEALNGLARIEPGSLGAMLAQTVGAETAGRLVLDLTGYDDGSLRDLAQATFREIEAVSPETARALIPVLGVSLSHEDIDVQTFAARPAPEDRPGQPGSRSGGHPISERGVRYARRVTPLGRSTGFGRVRPDRPGSGDEGDADPAQSFLGRRSHYPRYRR